jgi:glycosyltransferase involved in cell wall biosynthesis
VRNDKNGLHVPDSDPVALAQAIARLAEDHDLRERMGRAAHLYAQQYSWECIADRMMAFYGKALHAVPVAQWA